MKKFLIQKWKSLSFNNWIKVLLGFLCVFIILYYLLVYFQQQQENLYILEFIIKRLIFLLILFVFFEILQLINITTNFRSELELFNEGPKNKTKFLGFLRKWHYTIFFLMFVMYSLATTYYVNNILLSYILGTLAFVFAALHSYQFVMYTKAYLYKPRVTNNKAIQIRTIWTSASNTVAIKTAVVCYECIKGFVAMCFAGEAFYKLTHGGLDDISPVRQAILNQQFPEDKTKIWTERKVAVAVHNRAYGKAHDFGLEEILVQDMLNKESNGDTKK